MSVMAMMADIYAIRRWSDVFAAGR